MLNRKYRVAINEWPKVWLHCDRKYWVISEINCKSALTCSEAPAPWWPVCWAPSPRARCVACRAAWCWWRSRWSARHCPPTPSWSGHCPWPLESRLSDNSWHWPWRPGWGVRTEQHVVVLVLSVVWARVWTAQNILVTRIDQLSPLMLGAPFSHCSLARHVTPCNGGSWSWNEWARTLKTHFTGVNIWWDYWTFIFNWNIESMFATKLHISALPYYGKFLRPFCCWCSRDVVSNE